MVFYAASHLLNAVIAHCNPVPALGGWLKVYEMEKQVELQEAKNSLLALRNAKLAGDVKDLKDGTRAIEERARAEHGLIKEGEFFVQILPVDKASAAPIVDGLKSPTTKQ